MTDSLREHLSKAGKSKSPAKLRALELNRQKAIEKLKREGPSERQLQALAQARLALAKKREVSHDRQKNTIAELKPVDER